jgi:hypothetical protein
MALISDLGGDEAISTHQRALIEAAVRTKLLFDSVDAYVLAMESPVDKRHRRLWPVVLERQSLVAQLQSLLKDLGLERRAKDINLVDEIAKLQREAAAERLRKEGTADGGGGGDGDDPRGD